MGERRYSPDRIREQTRTEIEDLAKMFNEYRKHFHRSINDVRLDVGNDISKFYQSQEDLRVEVSSFISNHLIAADNKEAENMNNEILIDRLGKIEGRIGIIETEAKNITFSLGRIEGDIKGLASKIDQVLAKFDKIPTVDYIEKEVLKSTSAISTDIAVMQTNIVDIKKKQEDSVTNKKWIVTTILAFIGAAGAITKIIIG